MKPSKPLLSLFPWLGLLLIIGGLVYSLLAGELAGVASLLLVSGALLLIFTAVRDPARVRELVAGRTTRYGVANGLLVVLFTAVFILLYWIAYQNPQWRLDTTTAQEYSANPEILALLAQAESPLTVLGFYSPRAVARQESARAYLQTLTAATDQIRYEFIDWEANPVLANQYDITTDGTLVFILNEGQADERTAVLYNLTDRDVFAAVRQLIFPRDITAYLITGHGEPALDDPSGQGLAIAAELAGEVGINLQPLDLRLAGQIPADADLLLLIRPRRALTTAELDLISTFSAEGGALLVIRDVITTQEELAAEDDGLATWLTAVWGIVFRPDLVIDNDRALFERPFAFVVDNFGNHPIITPEVRQFFLLFDGARSLESVDTAVDGLLPTGLAFTSDTAWGETDLQTTPPAPDTRDATGPLTIAAALADSQSGARLVAVGDADFLLNDGIYLNGNSVFWLNTLNWLAGDEAPLDFVPRESTPRQLTLTAGELVIVQFIALFVG
ncbi:MAG: Gldg family protein, partial [Anaerolineales bacterium]|nr:Gldg family protein [Anaerolineales bacterium]